MEIAFDVQAESPEQAQKCMAAILALLKTAGVHVNDIALSLAEAPRD